MNPVLETIRQRRSVRSYKNAPVSKETLLTIIEAGNQAPSGVNSQPWRFVVVTDPVMKKKLVETALPNAKKYLESFRESNPERYRLIMKRYEDMEDPIYYSPAAIVFVIGTGAHSADSCPLACENMMLAAHSMGLGSIWVKFGSLVTDNQEIVKALDLRECEHIYGPIAIGYAKEVPKAPPKKAPVISWLSEPDVSEPAPNADPAPCKQSGTCNRVSLSEPAPLAKRQPLAQRYSSNTWFRASARTRPYSDTSILRRILLVIGAILLRRAQSVKNQCMKTGDLHQFPFRSCR